MKRKTLMRSIHDIQVIIYRGGGGSCTHIVKNNKLIHTTVYIQIIEEYKLTNCRLKWN